MDGGQTSPFWIATGTVSFCFTLRGRCVGIRRRLCGHHPARLSRRDRLRRAADRHRGDGGAARHSGGDAADRASWRPPRHPQSAAARRRVHDRERDPVSECAAHRAGRDDRVLRHDESLDRRSRHAGAAGACDDRALGRRPRAHGRLRALQPDRRARDGGGFARRGSARSARHGRHRQAHGAEAAVLRLCGIGRGHRAHLHRPAACRDEGAGAAGGARPLARHRRTSLRRCSASTRSPAASRCSR